MINRTICRVCTSPYRREIEFLVSQGISMSEIGRKYCPKFNCKWQNLSAILTRHTKRKHPPLLSEEPVGEPLDFQDYAKRLLKVGSDPEMMTPKRVSHGNVIAAQRTLLEERKVNGQLDAQKLAFLKFFRGSVVEGEVIDGNESDGVKSIPSNTD